MKKTQLIDALRNIQKRFISFLSIVFIIMLGTGGFFMARYSAHGLMNSASRFYRAQNFKDYEVASSIGVTETDLERLRDVEGIADAEGVIVLDGSLYKGDIGQAVTLLSWTDSVSKPYLVEGTRPEGLNECAVSEDFADEYGFKIGDQVTVETGEIYNVNPLLAHTCTITGIVDHPDYAKSKMTWSVILPLSSFNREGMENRYTRAFLTVDGVDQSRMFLPEYEKAVEPTTQRLRDLLPELETSSVDDAKRLANQRIDEEWEKAQEQIADAEKQIADGEAQLEAQLASARAQIASARAQLENARQQLLSGEAALRDAEALLAAVNQVKALLRGIDTSEMLEYCHNVIGLIDAYEYAGSQEERDAAYYQLQWYLNQPENAGKAEAIKVICGVDVREQAKDPNNLPAMRDTMREMCGVIMLVDASDNGVSPADILSDVARLDSYLEAINNAPDDASREAARQRLAEFVSDPEVQTRLMIADYYLGLNLTEVINTAVYNDSLDNAALAKLRAAFAKVRAARNTILNAEAMVAQGRAQLNSGWAMYYDGLHKVREGEAQMHALEADARSQIADAKRQLQEKIKEGEAQLADARAQVENLNCTWIVQERVVNGGFFEARNNINAAKSMGLAMGSLFLIVAALVCFSTLIIIIEEERKLVGTTKAFGFRNNEILMKYLIFGVSASVLGCLLGVAMGIGITLYVEHMFEQTMMYIYPIRGLVIEPGITLIVCLSAILTCGLVSAFACAGLLKTPAYYLMNGTTQPTPGKKKKPSKAASAKRGSLYSRLMVRNMLNEKARVLISIIIIAGGCAVVGVGLSMNFAFNGMTTRELSEVTLYDYRVDYDATSTTAEQKQELEQQMKDAGIRYISASYSPFLYESNNHLQGMYLLCSRSDSLDDFVRIRSYPGRKPIELPSDSILIQNKIMESYGVQPGTDIRLFDTTLNTYTAHVENTYLNYLGRMAVCSEAAYRKIFGKAPVDNCYYVLLDGYDRAAFETMLSNTSGGFVAEASNYYMTQLKGTLMLYNIIVVISIGIAVIMSFIILTNLASIFLNRKKKELIVMRINGFSIRETINYLVKETVVTSLGGLFLGILIGVLMTPFFIGIIEPPDCTYIRSTHWNAWLIAFIVEGIFTIIINGSVFRRVHKLNFHEIM